METSDLFHTSSRRIREFAEMQVCLYRHDPQLQQYFMQLQMKMQTSEGAAAGTQKPVAPRFILPAQITNGMGRFFSRPTFKADVLYCPAPYYDRKTENRLTVKTLLSLAKTGATILCLLPSGEPIRDELNAQLATVGLMRQVQFLDPMRASNAIEARLRVRAVRSRAWLALEEIGGVLESLGVRFDRKSQSGFEHTASYIDAWERVAPFVEFETAIVRCHWNTLCSSVCQTAMARGKPTMTFQQGVVGHTLDVPVTATKYVAFGVMSAAFLQRVNRRFHQSAERPEANVDYLPGGCMIDEIQELPDQFDLKTLLVVDVQVNQGDFYGVGAQCQALLQFCERLLSEDLPLHRVIIRPHPHWSDLELDSILAVARAHPEHCEISHPAWPLEDDLRRSSAVIGIFSGALTVAAASGLPSYFLSTENGFMTEDLACFSSQMLLLEDAYQDIRRILSDRGAYETARKTSRENARQYYSGGTNLDIGPAFFERFLAHSAATDVTGQGVQ